MKSCGLAPLSPGCRWSSRALPRAAGGVEPRGAVSARDWGPLPFLVVPTPPEAQRLIEHKAAHGAWRRKLKCRAQEGIKDN